MRVQRQGTRIRKQAHTKRDDQSGDENPAFGLNHIAVIVAVVGKRALIGVTAHSAPPSEMDRKSGAVACATADTRLTVGSLWYGLRVAANEQARCTALVPRCSDEARGNDSQAWKR